MEYTITNADLCELAHDFTVEKCNENGIVIDSEDDSDETQYTEEAQEVFDEYYEFIRESLGI